MNITGISKSCQKIFIKYFFKYNFLKNSSILNFFKNFGLFFCFSIIGMLQMSFEPTNILLFNELLSPVNHSLLT